MNLDYTSIIAILMLGNWQPWKKSQNEIFFNKLMVKRILQKINNCYVAAKCKNINYCQHLFFPQMSHKV